MKIEEAIKDIKRIYSSVVGKSLEMAIKALEKQIPKKMNDIDEYEGDELCGFCPRCNKLQSNLLSKNFCGDCGQRIDWSEVRK